MRSWKTNLAISWLAQFICLAGFNAAFPFFAFYIRDLGVTDVNQLAWWSGAMVSAGPVVIAFTAPLWGTLADRYGRRLMVERAAFAQGLALAAMALVGNVHQLFVLRLIQGAFAGVIPAFMALVASFVPLPEMGFALGLMQMSVYAGLSVGPLVGGFIADHFGYRWTFGATGILLFIGGFLVVFFVQERFAKPSREQMKGMGLSASLRTIRSTLPVLGAMLAMGGIYLADAAPRPILPLFVEQLQSNASLVNTATGLFYGAVSLATAFAAAILGRLSDRLRYRTLLLGCALTVAVAYAGQGLAPNFGLLVVAGFVSGLCIGGLLPTANAVLARDTPREQQGAIYGFSHSVNHLGGALGPMLGATMATAVGLRGAFFTAAGLALVLAIGIALLVKPGPQRRPAPAALPANPGGEAAEQGFDGG